MAFDPNKHLQSIKGQPYLGAQWRLVWFRDAQPNGRITTELLEHKPGDYAVFRATVSTPDGATSTGHKLVTAKQFGDYLAKSETQSIARALAAAGYGTQYAIELTEEDVTDDDPATASDAPAQTPQKPSPAPPDRARISAAERDTIQQLIADTGLDIQKICQRYKVPSLADLTPADGLDLKRKLLSLKNDQAKETAGVSPAV